MSGHCFLQGNTIGISHYGIEPVSRSLEALDRTRTIPQCNYRFGFKATATNHLIERYTFTDDFLQLTLDDEETGELSLDRRLSTNPILRHLARCSGPRPVADSPVVENEDHAVRFDQHRGATTIQIRPPPGKPGWRLGADNEKGLRTLNSVRSRFG